MTVRPEILPLQLSVYLPTSARRRTNYGLLQRLPQIPRQILLDLPLGQQMSRSIQSCCKRSLSKEKQTDWNRTFSACGRRLPESSVPAVSLPKDSIPRLAVACN